MQTNFKKIINYSFTIFFLFVLFQAVLVDNAYAGLWSAQEGMGENYTISKEFGHTSGSPGDIRVIVGEIISVILGFIGLILVVLMVIAGFKWMTAQGEEAKVTEAKNTIKNCVIGILIVTMAYAISYYVTHELYDITSAF